MAYLASNQGSGRTCFVSAKTVTRIEAVIIAVVPSPYPQLPEKQLSWHANAFPARKRDHDEHRHTAPEWRCQGEEAFKN